MSESFTPLTPEERRALVEAPLSFESHAGKSFSGWCHTRDQDTAHRRYLRSMRRANEWYTHPDQDNGYLP